MTYKRGDVCLVEEHDTQGSEIKKTRPWVIVGANQINNARHTLVVVPLSTKVKEIPGLSIKVYFDNNFLCAVLDQIRAVDKKRILRQEGNLSTYEMELIDAGLRQVLCL
jgi:mRNA interferase MazF